MSDRHDGNDGPGRPGWLPTQAPHRSRSVELPGEAAE
jgi:hypothetical protein